MHEERVDKNNERGLACDGLAPFSIGDYIELHSGVLGKVIHINAQHRVFILAYLWKLGTVETLYQQLMVESYHRHATVNEITLLKLQGLV